jgi:phosphatidylinositol alpha 1,6-mannosyltransferase
VRPWAGRRVRGRTEGDGRAPKHTRLVDVVPRRRKDARTRSGS